MPKENLSIKLKESLDCLKKYKELPSSILTLISSIETVIRKLDGCDESNDTVKATTTFEMSKAEAIFIIESSVR